MCAVAGHSRSADVDDTADSLVPDTSYEPPPQMKKSFRQQTLTAYQPKFRIEFWCPLYFLGAIAFITLGAVLYSNQRYLQVFEFDYTEKCTQKDSCLLNFKLEKDFPKPVFMYYALSSFHQNHRRFISSRSDKQLLAESLNDKSLLGSCEPLIVDAKDKIYLPCGAIANSLFSDSFKVSLITSSKTLEVPAESKGIAWQSDIDRKYGILKEDQLKDKAKPRDWTPKQNVVAGTSFKDDEELMNWIRPAFASDFKKLYRIIQHKEGTPFADGLPKGDYQLEIPDHSYPINKSLGRKRFVLANTNSLGGRTKIYPVVSMILGCSLFILAVVLLIFKTQKRNEPQEKRLRNVQLQNHLRSVNMNGGYESLDSPERQASHACFSINLLRHRSRSLIG